MNTSHDSPYDDQETVDGFIYAYRAGAVDQPDNQALRAAHTTGAPLVYFVGTRPGMYRPIYPCFVTGDDRAARAVVLTPGRMVGPYDQRESLLPDDLLAGDAEGSPQGGCRLTPCPSASASRRARRARSTWATR